MTPRKDLPGFLHPERDPRGSGWCLIITGFLYYWVERTDRHLESIHDERQQLQQQLEDQRKRVQESRAIQDQRAELEQARKQ